MEKFLQFFTGESRILIRVDSINTIEEKEGGCLINGHVVNSGYDEVRLLLPLGPVGGKNE